MRIPSLITQGITSKISLGIPLRISTKNPEVPAWIAYGIHPGNSP